MKYLLLSEVCFDISDTHYSHISPIFLGIEEFSSIEEAEEWANELLKEYVERTSYARIFDSTVIVKPIS